MQTESSFKDPLPCSIFFGAIMTLYIVIILMSKPHIYIDDKWFNCVKLTYMQGNLNMSSFGLRFDISYQNKQGINDLVFLIVHAISIIKMRKTKNTYRFVTVSFYHAWHYFHIIMQKMEDWYRLWWLTLGRAMWL